MMTVGTAEKPSFKGLALVGGHPALDLLNSVKYRGRTDPMDTLCSYSDVVDWAELVQVIDGHEAEVLRGLAAEDPETSGAIYKDICIFRENLRCVMEPSKDSAASQKIAAAALEHVIEALKPSAQIDIGRRILTRSYPIGELVDLRHRLVQMAVELMEMVPMPQIGSCAADDCDWLFVDQSKAKRRRWCDAKTCGNRARVRRFRTQGVGK